MSLIKFSIWLRIAKLEHLAYKKCLKGMRHARKQPNKQVILQCPKSAQCHTQHSSIAYKRRGGKIYCGSNFVLTSCLMIVPLRDTQGRNKSSKLSSCVLRGMRSISKAQVQLSDHHQYTYKQSLLPVAYLAVMELWTLVRFACDFNHIETADNGWTALPQNIVLALHTRWAAWFKAISDDLLDTAKIAAHT